MYVTLFLASLNPYIMSSLSVFTASFISTQSIHFLYILHNIIYLRHYFVETGSSESSFESTLFLRVFSQNSIE